MHVSRRLTLLLAAAAVGLAGAAAAEPVKLRIQWPSVPGHVTPLMPNAPDGLLRHYGKSYTIEPVFIQGSTPAMQALAAGELEIATFTPSALALAVGEAKLDVRAIAQMITTDVPGHASPKFWVRADEVKKIEDLKGKIVAVNAHGSAIDAAQKLVLKRHGLKEGTDYQTVEVRIPAMLPTLESGRAHAAFLIRPFDIRAAKNPNLKPLFGMGDAFGPSETGFWVAKTDWLNKNRAVVVDAIEDNIRMRRWAQDPKTRPEAVKLLAAFIKQPVENLMDWAYTKKDTSYQEPSANMDVARIQKNIEDTREAGVLEVSIKAADYADLSLAAEAAARVK